MKKGAAGKRKSVRTCRVVPASLSLHRFSGRLRHPSRALWFGVSFLEISPPVLLCKAIVFCSLLYALYHPPPLSPSTVTTTTTTISTYTHPESVVVSFYVPLSYLVFIRAFSSIVIFVIYSPLLLLLLLTTTARINYTIMFFFPA